MTAKKGLTAIIVDDSPTAAQTLADDLRAAPEFGNVLIFNNYVEATLPLLEIQPDVLFLDVEVPGKTGLEFLQSIRPRLNFTFKVVFYTAYTDYMLDAIRHSAFDFLLKPYKQSELRTVIERIVGARHAVSHFPQAEALPMTHKLAIQTVSEILFIKMEQILMFNYNSEQRSWQLLLTDKTCHTLKRGTSATDLLTLHPILARISNTCILNLTYLTAVENNTQRCRLSAPFDGMEVIASRRYFAKLKERFELL